MTAMARLLIRVQPGARRTGFVGWYGEMPRLAVAALPVDGAANQAVIEALAEALSVRPRQVRLIGGGSSRTKRFEIDDVTDDDLAARLNAAIRR